MSDALAVLLGGEVAGVLRRLPGGRLRFDYDRAYQERPAPTPLSLSMPVEVDSHSDRVVSPWLWGLLPDNREVLRRWAREFGVRANSAFALLATPIGEDCAGAVRFVSPEGLEGPPERPGHVTWLDDEAVAERLRELREDSTAWLGESFTGQFSLAGAQAKTALLLEDGRWGEPRGATPTTHILKPGVSSLDDHDLNEHLCLDAARRAGLVAARTTISRFARESAVVVARYDRTRSEGGAIRRVHQEDLCQALSVPPERKHESDGGPGAARIVRLLRDSMPASVAEDSVGRFIDALIWNWLIGGTDAHAKNYSLLLAGDQTRLAPLYDVASALPYARSEHELRLAMKIGDRYDVHARRNPWPRTASELGLDSEAPRRVPSSSPRRCRGRSRRPARRMRSRRSAASFRGASSSWSQAGRGLSGGAAAARQVWVPCCCLTQPRMAREWERTVPSGSFRVGSFSVPVACLSSSREPLRRKGRGLPRPAITFS